MRYLSCLLVHEGNSDRWFLPPLLERAIRELWLARARVDLHVSVAAVDADHQRVEDIVLAVADEAFDLLLHHHDGAPQAICNRVVSAVQRDWRLRRPEPLVPVLPVRETESWILADPDVVRTVLGSSEFAAGAGWPQRARDAENVPDPKVPLRRTIETARGRQRATAGQQSSMKSYFEAFGDHVRLDRLREVPSFAAWWQDMSKTLEGLGYNHG